MPHASGGLQINSSGRTFPKSPNPSGTTSYCVAPLQLGVALAPLPNPCRWGGCRRGGAGRANCSGATSTTAVAPDFDSRLREVIRGVNFVGYRRGAWLTLACGCMEPCKKPDLVQMPPPEKPQCAYISAGSCRGGFAGSNCSGTTSTTAMAAYLFVACRRACASGGTCSGSGSESDSPCVPGPQG